MSILSTRKQRDYKLVGASLPSSVHEFLSLYAAAKGTTITKIVAGALQPWIRQQKSEEQNILLIVQVAKRVAAGWPAERKKSKRPNVAFVKYLENVTAELSRKGLKESDINQIIKEVKNDIKSSSDPSEQTDGTEG